MMLEMNLGYVSYLATLGSTPFFSSRRLMVTGSVAEEDAVPKAVVKAFAMLAMNLRNSSPAHQCLQVVNKALRLASMKRY